MLQGCQGGGGQNFKRCCGLVVFPQASNIIVLKARHQGEIVLSINRGCGGSLHSSSHRQVEKVNSLMKNNYFQFGKYVKMNKLNINKLV